MSKIHPNVTAFFERFPRPKKGMPRQGYNHSTHSMYVPGILQEGLRGNPELFPPSQGQFLLDMYRRYGSGDPNDVRYIQDRILDSRQVYLSAERPDRSLARYGIPERLMLLMRGMNTLAGKESLSVAERAFAVQALAGHIQSLTQNDPAITVLEVDPLAPSLVNSRLGVHHLEEVQDAETAKLAARYVDGGYANNIPVTGTIDPDYINVLNSTPITSARAVEGVYTNAGWASSIR